ncbi:hypothetical protein [Mycetohabitans sp. B3]|nr:hypothetical protein [Mycetohabitans sp. B3]
MSFSLALRGNPMALLHQRAKRSAPRMKGTNRLHGLPRSYQYDV